MNPRGRSRLAGGLVFLLAALHVFAEGGAFTLARTASGHELKTPGGQLVQWDWERTHDDDVGLTRDEIRAALSDAGLVDVHVTTAFTVDVDGHAMSPLMGHGRRPVDPG